MRSIKFLGVKFCTESFITSISIIVLSLNFLAANTEGGLKAPLSLPVLQGAKQSGLPAELCVLTGLTAEFPQVA